MFQYINKATVKTSAFILSCSNILIGLQLIQFTRDTSLDNSNNFSFSSSVDAFLLIDDLKQNSFCHSIVIFQSSLFLKKLLFSLLLRKRIAAHICLLCKKLCIQKFEFCIRSLHDFKKFSTVSSFLDTSFSFLFRRKW